MKDIPYNFLIGDDGNVYEGRGFRFEGQHTENVNGSTFNDIGICVAFIGTYKIKQPSAAQVEAFENFLDYYKNEGIVNDDCKLFFQDQLSEPIIAADALLQTLKTWQNFHSGQYNFKILLIELLLIRHIPQL